MYVTKFPHILEKPSLAMPTFFLNRNVTYIVKNNKQR